MHPQWLNMCAVDLAYFASRRYESGLASGAGCFRDPSYATDDPDEPWVYVDSREGPRWRGEPFSRGDGTGEA